MIVKEELKQRQNMGIPMETPVTSKQDDLNETQDVEATTTAATTSKSRHKTR